MLRDAFCSPHNPVRQPLGGFRCSKCGRSGESLRDFGTVDSGYIKLTERQRELLEGAEKEER